MSMQSLEKPETPCKYAEEKSEASIPQFQDRIKLGRKCKLQPKMLCFNWNKPEAIATCIVRRDHEGGF